MMISLLFAARAASLMVAGVAAEAPAPSLPPMPTPPPGRPLATLALGDIVPGSRGVCYTVFEGTAVEPFAFIVKSVMPKFLGPEDDLLLVRLVGDKPEFTGVVSGMSGSPCFIDDKLVGALSYSFASFAKEPIAGITAIAAMKRCSAKSKAPRPYRRALARQHAHAKAQSSSLASAELDGVMAATPIATPLGLGNVSPLVRAYFAPQLVDMGFLPLATGVVGHSDQAPTTLESGGSIAVILAQGDINMAATGTVTTVHKGDVLAFGHPFTTSGPVSFPMATSRIVNTMASSMHSFKMAVAGPTVGEIHDDRLPAIAGTLGAAPAMVPVHGTLKTPSRSHEFFFEVARDPTLTPRIVAIGSLNALTNRLEASGSGTGRVTATFTVEGHKPITRTFVEAHAHGGMIFTHPVIKMAEVMATLWDSDFAPPQEVSLRLSAELSLEPEEEVIQDITFDRNFVQSGGLLRIAVHVRGLTGTMRVESFDLPIPARWRGEHLEVVAVGGQDGAQFLRELQGAPNPQHYDDVLAELRQRPQEGELYVFVLRQGATLHRGGRSYGNVPPSALVTLGQAQHDHLLKQNIDYRGQRHAPGAILGIVKRGLDISPKATSQCSVQPAHP